MQCTGLILGMISLCALAGCTVEAEMIPLPQEGGPAESIETTAGEVEAPVAIEDLPAAVRAAVLAAVPGIELQEAEHETEAAGTHYCVHGKAAGVSYEVEVAPDGTVLSIEEGDDEDGDEDHEDGGDDDDD